MRIYISGKISGLDPEEVRRTFTEAEEFLRSLGLEVVSPLDNGLAADAPWISHMCRDIEMLHGCDAIYMTEGWHGSTGACLEYDFAVRTGKTVVFASEILRHRRIALTVESAIGEVTGLHLNEYNTKSRKRDRFFARMLFVYYCRRKRMSLTDIATYIRRDRSSMLYLLKKYCDEVRYNPSFRTISEHVDALLKARTDDQHP